MSDRFYPIQLDQLLAKITNEYKTQKSIFGFPRELFFNREQNKFAKQQVFNQTIDNPIGVAAGPHTQLSQNIITAWLLGARYIELKTVQNLDELEVSKPCIDMQDEGYNCEWSQELRIRESYNEYLNAWIAIHYLHNFLGFSGSLNTIFNMSVGYNLEGIKSEKVQWFFDKMNNCSKELNQKKGSLKELFPEISNLEIPSQISNNITLSTMHGCPADEIEQIANYLLKEKKLHTYIKLNPTLLGPEKLRHILNKTSGFKTNVPDEAFGHDLKFNDALEIISNLRKVAKQEDLEFGIKLTNTLESQNIKDVFGNDVDMMYMSGRALHPISVNVAQLLQSNFDGELNLSFSGGADAFNASKLLLCGFKTITVSSDLLKPGGYGRLAQYFDELKKEFESTNSNTIGDYIIQNQPDGNPKKITLEYLNKYAGEVITDTRYQNKNIHEPSIKTDRKLNFFDCIAAPCTQTCATNQNIPQYMFHTANGDYQKAFDTIIETNSFPTVTGMVCDHLCQNKCTRINYDSPLLIREVKRFISENANGQSPKKVNQERKVAIIGAGPSGLSCAYYLAKEGIKTEVFESKSKAGGMVQYAIPGFRLTDEAIDKDLERIKSLGVEIHFNHKIDKNEFEKIQQNFDAIFIGIGAQLATPLNIENIQTKGVLNPLQFLFDAKAGKSTGIGNNVVIIGGGNTAMDAARTAYRLIGETGKVTIVYRRTVNQMPADQGEIKAVIEEGVDIVELTSPERVIEKNSVVDKLLCSKMRIGEKDNSGRPRPVKIKNSEFEITCDTIIPAIGQNIDIDFIQNEQLQTNTGSYKTNIDGIYIGGDAMRGAATAIKAIGDGRKAAEEIIRDMSLKEIPPKTNDDKNISTRELMLKRMKRQYAPSLKEIPLDERRSFKLVSATLEEKEIKEEASRCLYCDEICNICTTVCPNNANISYEIEPFSIKLQKIISDENGDYSIVDDTDFTISQSTQVLNIADFCNECGNCQTFCPTSGAPYKDKPKVHLTKKSYEESTIGFFYEKLTNIETIYYKKDGNISKLTKNKNILIYEHENIKVEVNDKNYSVIKIIEPPKSKLEITFTELVEMDIILKGILQSDL